MRLIDALTNGDGPSFLPPVRVWFADDGDRVSTGHGTTYRSLGWSDAQRADILDAIGTVQDVISFDVEVVSNRYQANLQIVSSDDLGGWAGLAGQNHNGARPYAWIAMLNDRDQSDDFSAGSWLFSVAIHEFLHVLWLQHPHDRHGGTRLFPGVNDSGDLGDFELNQKLYTVMSYNWSDGNPVSPMALDIAALQEVYQPNTTHNESDTIYRLEGFWQFQAIWDTGGTDTIVADPTRAAIIDLRAATLEVEEGGGGFRSYTVNWSDGYTIANGVVIERAIGGAGDDSLTGNAADNDLSGGGGAATLRGGAGGDSLLGQGDADRLFGEAGNDRLFGGTGDDRLDGGAGGDLLRGGDGADILLGRGQADRLYGEAGDDELFGHGGNDRLVGGDGADLLRGGGGADRLVGKSLRDRLFGQNGDDQLFGGNGDDRLYGGVGDDTLGGGQGRDRLFGGAGDDRLVGGGGGDSFVFEDGFGDDTVIGFNALTGAEKIDLSAVSAIVDFADLQANHLGLVGGEATITDGTDTITLLGISLGDLGNNDFVF